MSDDVTQKSLNSLAFRFCVQFLLSGSGSYQRIHFTNILLKRYTSQTQINRLHIQTLNLRSTSFEVYGSIPVIGGSAYGTPLNA